MKQILTLILISTGLTSIAQIAEIEDNGNFASSSILTLQSDSLHTGDAGCDCAVFPDCCNRDIDYWRVPLGTSGTYSIVCDMMDPLETFSFSLGTENQEFSYFQSIDNINQTSGTLCATLDPDTEYFVRVFFNTPVDGNAYSLKPSSQSATSLNSTLVVGENTVPSKNALLELKSDTKGFLPPRLGPSEIYNMNPEAGMMVFSTLDNTPVYYDGDLWRKFSGDEYFELKPGVFHEGGIIIAMMDYNKGIVYDTTTVNNNVVKKFGCHGTNIVGLNDPFIFAGWALGSGAESTQMIVDQCTDTDIAAYYVDTLSVTYDGVVYDDWFLPGTWAMDAIQKLNQAGFGNFVQGSGFIGAYEFGSLDNPNGQTVNARHFGINPNFNGAISKNTTERIIPVRAFDDSQ